MNNKVTVTFGSKDGCEKMKSSEGSRRYDFRIQSNLIEKLLAFYELTRSQENETKAIHKAIEDVILKLTIYTKEYKKSVVSKNNAPINTTDKKDKLVYFREKPVYIKALKKYYGVNTNSKAIQFAINDVLTKLVSYKSIPLEDFDRKNFFYMTGQKNSQMNKVYKTIFNAVEGKYNLYLEPFTGTGNVLFHKLKQTKEIINDNSEGLINLLKVLRDNPVELKAKLLLLDYNKETFIENLEKIKSNDFQGDRIDYAVSFFYLSFGSVYGGRKSFSKNHSTESYLMKLDWILHLSTRLKNVEINKNDALFFIDKYNMQDVLIYCDSPYPFTEKYYRNNNSKEKLFKSHKALSNRLLSHSGVFIYSCRVTSSYGLKKRGVSDAIMQNKINSLYHVGGKELFYIDIELNKTNGQVERIITNFHFEGCRKYN